MLYETNYLEHHGIKGQRWGTRRFQNEDGTLTAEGRDRYGVGESDSANSQKKSRAETREERKARYKRGKEFERERRAEESRDYENQLKEDEDYQREKHKKERLDWDAAVNQNKSDFYRDWHRYDADQKMKDKEYAASEKAQKNSREYIRKKHGDTAVADMDYYTSTSSKRKAVAMIATVSALALGSLMYKQHQQKKATQAYYNDLHSRYSAEFDKINRMKRNGAF